MTRGRLFAVASVLVLLATGFALVRYESFEPLFDASYVGSGTCADCHTTIHPQWHESPHAKIARRATADAVVGNFDNAVWRSPADPASVPPAARMRRAGDSFVMSLRRPDDAGYVDFSIEYVVGYQYRQTYLTREAGGILRRLPLQWSPSRAEFFPYWNLQENSLPTVADLWAQMRAKNSAWNLFCARCHTTHLQVIDKDEHHTRATTQWIDTGVACEACHGPGGHHVNYFRYNRVNRVVAWLNSKLRDEPVAYIASARKLSKNESTSVCARCHGADILLARQDLYRSYEPGYSKEGRINDLSPYYREGRIVPGRTQPPTLEVWADGEPKGIGMLFRSFVESACFQAAEIRCFDCHNPHQNKLAAEPGLMQAGPQSDAWCLRCHESIAAAPVVHSKHAAGSPGSHCYDCHLPKIIYKLASGQPEFARTHRFSKIPDPAATLIHGMEGSPNACNLCHTDRSATWAAAAVRKLWGTKDDGV